MSIIKNIGIVTLVIYAFACIPTQTPYASDSVKQAVSDSAITTNIKAKYIADDRIKSLKIHVETINGIVILTGRVPNVSVEEHAISIAKNTEGVKEVASKLKFER
jgi:osmotically-inducible protein OsmY